MRKMLLKYLSFYMIIALIIAVAFIYQFQTSVIQSSRTTESNEKLLQVEERLKQNDENIQQLTENISQSNLAKTRAFAQIIYDNPSIINSIDEINKIAEMLMVDELHVTDENGILRYGNVPDYYNLDFSKGEQTKPFLKILSDPSMEIVQEPQPNAAEGIVIQYIGVSRKDKPGIVQVGMKPEILENMLQSTKIDNVLSTFDFGNTGYVFAIDKNSKQIIAAQNQSFIGKSYSSIGFPDSVFSDETGASVIDGKDAHFFSKTYDNMIIGTVMPDDEYYEARNSNTISVSVSIFIIFLLLLILINSLVNRKIVRGIHNVTNGLSKIKDGDLYTEIKEYGNKEFKLLSDGINSMVASIRDNILKNNELMKKQKYVFEQNIKLINNIKGVSESINNDSKRTFDMMNSIYTDSKNQENSIISLNALLKNVTKQLEIDASLSAKVSESADNVVSHMFATRENMLSLKDAMNNISDLSHKIESITGEVNSIASQTSMLSINASVEASRAGEEGRGFAVVAAQIGELAKKCTDAAKETAYIISNAIAAVENVQKTADSTVSEFLAEVNIIEGAKAGIGKISEITNSQYNEIKNVLSGLENIAGIAEKNSVSASESQRTSAALKEQADMLNRLINN